MPLDETSKKYKILWCNKYGAVPANTSSFQCAALRSYKLVLITQKLFSALFCHLITCIAPSLYHSSCLSKVVPIGAMKVHRETGGTAPLILNIGTKSW